jgi:hypothetical protein
MELWQGINEHRPSPFTRKNARLIPDSQAIWREVCRIPDGEPRNSPLRLAKNPHVSGCAGDGPAQRTMAPALRPLLYLGRSDANGHR